MKNSNTTVLYEYPLNERIRIFMRLEYMFNQAEHLSNQDSIFSSQTAILSIIEIINLLERNDLRSELLKEFDKNIQSLTKHLDTPNVNTDKLNSILDKMNNKYNSVSKLTGKIGKLIKQDDMLTSIRQRAAISPSICNFDIPALHSWMHYPCVARKEHLNSWLNDFYTIRSSISMLLDILRESSIFEVKVADSGFFQKSIDVQQSCQIVRVQLNGSLNCFPETSGGKHRINVRFLYIPRQGEKPVQVKEKIEFDLACCSI